MALSYELISQFAKLTTKDRKNSSESTVYGTVMVDANGKKYVKLDGSDQIAEDNQPTVNSASANANVGERVSVLIKDHTATITGNISSPAARTGDVDEVKDAVSEIKEFDIMVGDQLQVHAAYFNELRGDYANFGELTAAIGKITELEANDVTITGQLDAANASITNLHATIFDAETGNIKFATIAELTTINASIGDLQAAKASIEDLNAHKAEIKELVAKKATIEDLNAANAEIETLKTNKLDAEQAKILYASVEALNATNAEIDTLETKILTVETLDGKYAQIDFANIDKAAIEALFTKSGIIKDLVVSEGYITRELVGVKIKGDLIEAGTLKADRLVVKGSDGNYYALNTDFTAMPGVEPVAEDAIHGSVMVANSITAEKIHVDDLSAFEAKIGGFEIDSNAIHSIAKNTVTASAPGIYLDDDGQMAVGDNNNYIKYYKDSNDNYKLEISSVDKMKIGARNLIRNSKSLIFQDYYFESQAPSDSDADSTAILGTGVLGTMILGKES